MPHLQAAAQGVCLHFLCLHPSHTPSSSLSIQTSLQVTLLADKPPLCSHTPTGWDIPCTLMSGLVIAGYHFTSCWGQFQCHTCYTHWGRQVSLHTLFAQQPFHWLFRIIINLLASFQYQTSHHNYVHMSIAVGFFTMTTHTMMIAHTYDSSLLLISTVFCFFLVFFLKGGDMAGLLPTIFSPLAFRISIILWFWRLFLGSISKM